MSKISNARLAWLAQVELDPEVASALSELQSLRQLDKEQESGQIQPSVSLSPSRPEGVGDGEVKRYIDRCKEMSEGGRYQWWSRLAEILSALESHRPVDGETQTAFPSTDETQGALETQEEEAVDAETRLAQLEEIADGAWGDNPMVRGKARDEAARLRSSAHPTAVQKEEEGQTVSEDIVDRILAECPRYAVKQSHMGTEPNGKWLQVSDVRAALTAALVKP